MLTPDDEITASENIINLPEVRTRIAALKPFRVEDTRQPESALPVVLASYVTRGEAEAHVAVHGPGVRVYLEVVEYGDESEELAGLTALEAELSRLMAGDHASAINVGYAETFVRDELEDSYGEEAIGALDCYVDWDRYVADRSVDWSSTIYRGTTYYLVP